MMKKFFSENLNGMTFTFTVLVLLNAVLERAQIIDIVSFSESTLILALLVFLSWTLSFLINTIDFRSTGVFHLVNYTSQFMVLVLVANELGFFQITIDSILTNSVVYAVLYFLNVKRRQHELKQTAASINKQLGNRIKE